MENIAPPWDTVKGVFEDEQLRKVKVDGEEGS